MFVFFVFFVFISVRAHIDFISEVKDSVKKPYCTSKIKKSDLHTFGSLQVHTASEIGIVEGLKPLSQDLKA